MPLQPSTLQFLQQLARNNQKTWFDAHRNAYEAARADVARLVDNLIALHSLNDPGIAGLTAKECLFRIQRDVRFSQNKAPYKTNFGASIKPGGKKSPFAGYYLHVEPGASFVGGGIWMPEASVLKKIRQEIDYNFPTFRQIIEAPPFKKFYGDLYTGENQQLQRIPKGYEPDNPAGFYLRLKSFVAIHDLDDAALLHKKLEDQLLHAFATLQPLLTFLNEVFVNE